MKPNTFKAAIFRGVGQVDVVDLPYPPCGDDEAIVRNMLTGICGSDIYAFQKHGPESRIWVDEEFGHEAISEVVEVGRNVQGLSVGDRVFVNQDKAFRDIRRISATGGFSNYLRIPQCEVGYSLLPIDKDLPLKAAVLFEPFVIGIRGVKVRSYKLDLATTGLILALGTGLFSTVGMVTTSMLSDRLRRRSAKGPLRVVIIGSLLHLGIGLLVLSCNNLVLSVIGLCAMGAVMLVNVGPTNAMISEIAPPYARGVGFALFTFVSNVVGAGLGPLTVGLLSDQLGGDPAALREAMMIVLLSQGISILAYWQANRRLSGTLPADRIVRPSDMEAQS